MGSKKKAVPDLRLETDSLTFDYLIYDTTKVVLRDARKRLATGKHSESRASSGWEEMAVEVENLLNMVDSFHTIFMEAHHKAQLPAILHFRLHLLRFASLFVYRHSLNFTSPPASAMRDLRFRNEARARAWGQAVGMNADLFPEEVLDCYKGFQGQPIVDAETGATVGKPRDEEDSNMVDFPEDDSTSEDPPVRPRMLDLVPTFVALTARRGADDPHWHNTHAWMKLAGEMMLQAALEQYQVCGKSGRGVLLEAFTWGVEGIVNVTSGKNLVVMQEHKQGADSTINAVFRPGCEDTQVHDTLPSWAQTRTDYLNNFIPSGFLSRHHRAWAESGREYQNQRILEHHTWLEQKFDIATFDQTMVDFLEALCESYDMPVLAQLECTDVPVVIDGQEIGAEEASALRGLVVGRT